MFEGIINFMSKFVPNFSRNDAPPPIDVDDAGPRPAKTSTRAAYNFYTCRVCERTLKLTQQDGKHKAVDHALNHGDMYYYNCKINGCKNMFRTKSQIKYHYKIVHEINSEISGHAIGDLPLDDPVFYAIVKKSYGSILARSMCRTFTRKTKPVKKLVNEMEKMSLE